MTMQPMTTDTATNYTADSIKVLTHEQTTARFEWLEAATLAAEYGRPLAYVKRGLEACNRAQVPHTYFVERYLRGDKSVPRHEGADEAMRDIIREQRG